MTEFQSADPGVALDLQARAEAFELAMREPNEYDRLRGQRALAFFRRSKDDPPSRVDEYHKDAQRAVDVLSCSADLIESGYDAVEVIAMKASLRFDLRDKFGVKNSNESEREQTIRRLHRTADRIRYYKD